MGVEGPSSTAVGRSSFPVTILPPPLLAACERRERDSSQLISSSRTITSRARAASDLEGDQPIVDLTGGGE